MNNRVEIIPNEQGNKITPSCVAWDGTQILVGESAKNQIGRNPHNTVFDVKRLMGVRFSDSRVQEDIKSFPFKVIEGSGEKPMIVFEHESEEKRFSPTEISSMILRNMKEAAEAFLGTTVTDAVITVPAYFSDQQRQAVGGGTFDVSLLNISKTGKISVKAVGGDAHLGGENFDKLMVNHCVQEFNKKEKKDVTVNARAMMRLKLACEKAIRDLSSTTQTPIEIDFLYEGIDFSTKFSRAKFEELNADYFNLCIKHVKNCLRDGKTHKDNVDDIVIVGGSTRIPKVQKMLMEYFDGKQLCKSINADEAVAYGAAVLAANLGGKRIELVPDLILLDVTPLSLGIWLDVDDPSRDDMSVIIPRNTPIPFTKEVIYWTKNDNQQSMIIKVYQGESCKTKENIFLDSFSLPGIPAAPARQQKVRVGFNIDADGILNVSAEVISTGNKRTVRIATTRDLSKDEIKKRAKIIK